MTEVIVAFDVSTQEELASMLDMFQEPIYVKIGMEAMYRFGASLLTPIKERGHKIFLDLKLHDIPNTVYHAMKQLAALPVDMINVHAGGGIDMMKKAVQAVKEINPNILCIAVTVLTSLDDKVVTDELLLNQGLEKTALHYAKNAKEAGMDGIVCSVHEVEKIHEVCGADFLCVTPGIALLTTQKNDQKRIATPQYAKEKGSDYIVVGRAITTSENPYQTYKQIKGDCDHE
ncbi:orotidine-5'-phosphate decarboxylase [Carnobacteriaceae bacterium zg-ZUI78]|nr:orotidine-5'-phosphate decarboxylase [Carnobacteriaceae bacterium zg-ZUI78]